MNEELEELSNTLLTLYQKNLAFLNENFPDIYERVEKLSDNINNGKVKEKYTLEFVDGYFDILNHENNGYYYHQNSYEDADTRAGLSNFTKDGSLDLLRKGRDGKSLVGNESYKDVLPVLQYINNNVDFDNIEFQKIHKFVFMDTGLGFHIQEIYKKLTPLTTLIIEPELEIFRLSLFVTDYSEFQKGSKKLFLSIEDEKLKRVNTIADFYQYHNYLNFNIKYHLLISNHSYLKDELIEFFQVNSVGSFPYTITLQNIHKTIGFIEDKKRFLDFNTMIDEKILKDKQVLLIAAGPSVDNYIDWIKEHQDKFIIVCVDIILKKLEINNIVPDIVVTIDPSHLCAEYLTTKDESFLKDSTIVLLSQQDPKVLEILGDMNYYFAQSIFLVSELGFLGSTSNVGSYALVIASHLGANKIFTIGNDAAFNQKTGSRYAADNALTTMDKTDNNHEDNTTDMISSFDVIEVKGNLRDTVKTNRVLSDFKNSFESTLEGLRNKYDIEAYNLSDGVYLEGYKPLTFEQMDKKVHEFKEKEKNIINLMNSVSKVIDKPDYEGDIKKINMMINRVRKYKKQKVKTRDEFLQKKLDIMIWLLEKSKETTSELFGTIFLLYTELADIYINFVLNLRQEDLFNEQHLSQLSQIWADGVIFVFKDLKKAIQ